MMHKLNDQVTNLDADRRLLLNEMVIAVRDLKQVQTWPDVEKVLDNLESVLSAFGIEPVEEKSP
jgi:hypothetical protein